MGVKAELGDARAGHNVDADVGPGGLAAVDFGTEDAVVDDAVFGPAFGDNLVEEAFRNEDAEVVVVVAVTEGNREARSRVARRGLGLGERLGGGFAVGLEAGRLVGFDRGDKFGHRFFRSGCFLDGSEGRFGERNATEQFAPQVGELGFGRLIAVVEDGDFERADALLERGERLPLLVDRSGRGVELPEFGGQFACPGLPGLGECPGQIGQFGGSFRRENTGQSHGSSGFLSHATHPDHPDSDRTGQQGRRSAPPQPEFRLTTHRHRLPRHILAHIHSVS